MKILFLTNNDISTPLINFLKKQDEEVMVYSDKINFDFIKALMPDIIISYNYKFIIKKDVIDLLKNKIINLHISLLPWNRGAHPNLWSFLENTPKGVSIHLIDEGVDTGPILLQKEVFFDETRETLESSYLTLHEDIHNLFKSNWYELRQNNITPTLQKEVGTFHYKKDFEKISSILGKKSWKIPIRELKENYNNCKEKNEF